MKMEKTGRRILLWAVDPRQSVTKPSLSMIKNLRGWARKGEIEIQPVYVVSPTKEEVEKEGMFQILERANGTLERYLRGISGLLKPQVVLDDSHSKEGAVGRLLEFADQLNPEWILVSTHGRKGLERIVFGSFSEKLLSRSKRPVFFLTHQVSPALSGQKKTVALYATDFSRNSESAFKKFVRDAGIFGFDIVVFHSLVYPMAMTAGEGIYLSDSYFEEQASWAQKRGERFIAFAKEQGVHATLSLKKGGVGVVCAEDIFEAAQESSADLIAAVSSSGPADRILAGSAAYDAFRANWYPVLIFGSQSLS